MPTTSQQILRVHADSDGTYGWRRLHAALRREGRQGNHKRVERLTRAERLVGAQRRAAGDRPRSTARVEFPRFGGHLTTEPFGRSERMSVDAQDPAVFRGLQA
jgi:putative transposase